MLSIGIVLAYRFINNHSCRFYGFNWRDFVKAVVSLKFCYDNCMNNYDGPDGRISGLVFETVLKFRYFIVAEFVFLEWFV